MRKNYRRAQYQAPKKLYRINTEITAEEVRLIDENGEHVGVLPLSEAIEKARAIEFDLVEIQPQAQPPVCKIEDYGRLKYNLEKDLRKQKAKQKKVEVKGIRLSLRIGQHDKDVRLSQAKRFLEQQDKVKVELVLRGRERQHAELGKKIIEQFIEALTTQSDMPIVRESDITIQGGRINVIIGMKC